jgi:thiol-disulfide isomerase/thioredoxin
LGAVAPELYMIKASDRDKIAKMGFENVKSSAEVTKLFYDHVNEINTLFYKLSDIKADFLVLVFWDVDCGHCQKEIPKLVDLYKEYQKEGKDVKVFSVYTQQELDKYLKYIDEKKLEWINVYDGVHYNNLAEKYDIYATPVIYVLDKNKVIKARRIEVEKIKDIVKDIEKEYQLKK